MSEALFDTSFKCDFDQESVDSCTFGNAEYSVSLLGWNASDVFLTKYKSFEIIIDSNDDGKLFSLIMAIVIQKPISVEIIPNRDSFDAILSDVHMTLLKGIHTVGIPKNCNVTVDGLRCLLQSTKICISGCIGITGDGLPLVSHSLKYIKVWGWGQNLRCSKEIMLFIDQVNYVHNRRWLLCSHRNSIQHSEIVHMLGPTES